MKRLRTAAAAIAMIGLASCTSDPPASTVPRLATSASAGPQAQAGNDDNPNAVAGDSSAGRRAALHAAAQCIREHGVSAYQDPVLTADGYVYTDDVAFRPIEGPQLDAIQTACHDLIRAANFAIRDQGPPPPKLIQAGVKSAACMRANGLPNFKDPTVDSHFSAGKGFGLDPTTLPPGGKQNPILQRAVDACRTLLDEEAAVSSLGNLGNA
ncbi:hypothetical protein BJ973_001550 [Actinoplanes tereljensis]|uniref:Lipoprotein n=1 Tax=Paractinoplanes tereljensis TaxID=571912 RepID=A0A919NKP7_9ACTN|nr:hypothetical protein [Actinoplanes tereljensis]GIF20544.1 hypothetical protein Ate02nite_32740 [Actinoplanes tereljensis]